MFTTFLILSPLLLLTREIKAPPFSFAPSPRVVPQVREGKQFIRCEHEALVDVLLIKQQVKPANPPVT